MPVGLHNANAYLLLNQCLRNDIETDLFQKLKSDMSESTRNVLDSFFIDMQMNDPRARYIMLR